MDYVKDNLAAIITLTAIIVWTILQVWKMSE